MFWTYFFMLLFLSLGASLLAAAASIWNESGVLEFFLGWVAMFFGLCIIAGVLVWADNIEILARFGA